MVSGVFLEGAKMVSYTSYQSMVEDYADSDEEEELKSLESYWVKEFGTLGNLDVSIFIRHQLLQSESISAKDNNHR